MRTFKKNILRTAEEASSEEILGLCVVWDAHNDDNIKMQLHGSINFSTFLAGRTLAFVDGLVYQYRINGVNVPCSINLTNNSTTIFFDASSLPVVMDEVLTQIWITIDMTLNTAEDFYLNFQFSAEEFPDQYTAEFDQCYE